MSDKEPDKKEDPEEHAQEPDQKAQESVPAEEEQEHKGAKLKRIREERGISLQTIHEATKVPLDALRAIEEGYKVRTLSEFYYRSFVKIYAKYLDIDVREVLDDHKKEELPKHIKKEPEFEVHILDRIDKFLTKKRKQRIFYALVALVGVFIFFKFVTFLMNRPPSQKEAKVEAPDRDLEKENVPEEPARQETRPPAVAPAPPAPSNGDQQAANEAVGKEVVLTVRAKENSWLRVRADGNIVFQSTLGAGDVETWTADEKIEITGRNISDLEFELNGKLIGSLGRSSRRAKGLVVTSEGLSVTR